VHRSETLGYPELATATKTTSQVMQYFYIAYILFFMLTNSKSGRDIHLVRNIYGFFLQSNKKYSLIKLPVSFGAFLLFVLSLSLTF